jgi:hypothetical protein
VELPEGNYYCKVCGPGYLMEIVRKTTEIQKHSWVEDLVDTDTKAMGTYLALLYLRVDKSFASYPVKQSGFQIMGEPKATQLYANYFAGRGTEARQAIEASRTFIDRLFEHEDVLNPDKRNRILDDIESEFYNEFVSAFKRYLKLDRIPEELREIVGEVLLDIKSQLYEKAVTTCGTTCIADSNLREKIRTFRGIEGQKAEELLSCLKSSGLLIEGLYTIYYYTFPAPCLSDEIIELITKPAIVGMRELIPPPPMPERFKVKPSREILEGIISAVFEDLGFKVSTNVSKEPRRGSPIEVDVWAERIVSGMRFSVYVSCKNWNTAIDRPVIDEENGRVMNLRDLPQLKAIVAKELTKPAKETAEADGFIVIELGNKAEAENAVQIYELVYRTFNELFTSIAPPRLRVIASKISDVRESLRKIEEELALLLAGKRQSSF